MKRIYERTRPKIPSPLGRGEKTCAQSSNPHNRSFKKSEINDWKKGKKIMAIFEIEKQGDHSKKIKIHDIFIDQNYIQKWGLKTTQDGKRSYWRVRGDLYISKADDDTKSSNIGFRINLSASENTFVGADDSILESDLKKALSSFKKALKNNEIYYHVVTKGSWNNQGKTIDYDGWIELKIQKFRHKVSIFEK